MKAPSWRSLAPFAAGIGAVYPFLVAALFYSFVVRARVKLGAWPLPYQPDPKALGFEVHDSLVMLGLFSSIPVSLLAPLLFFFAERATVDRRFWTKFLMMIAATGVFLVWARIDPGNFIEWYFD